MPSQTHVHTHTHTHTHHHHHHHHHHLHAPAHPTTAPPNSIEGQGTRSNPNRPTPAPHDVSAHTARRALSSAPSTTSPHTPGPCYSARKTTKHGYKMRKTWVDTRTLTSSSEYWNSGRSNPSIASVDGRTRLVNTDRQRVTAKMPRRNRRNTSVGRTSTT